MQCIDKMFNNDIIPSSKAKAIKKLRLKKKVRELISKGYPKKKRTY